MKNVFAMSVFAMLFAVTAASAIDDLPTRVMTRARGVVIAIHGNALTITDSEVRNGEREVVIGPTAVITEITDDQNSYTPGDIDDITPGQTVNVGLAIDGATAGTVQVMGEYTSGVVKEIRDDAIVITNGGSSAKLREIPFFGKTEIRMPAEGEARKQTTRVAERKELETGQTVSVRFSMVDRAKAKLVTVTRLAKLPNPTPTPRVNERRRDPSTN